LEYPVLIRQVHSAYVAAGADVATTATYQLSFDGFARRGLDRAQTVAAVRLSVRLAREAGPKIVAASVGPYGAFLADGWDFRGDYGLSARQLLDWHRPRLEALADSGADLLACETIPCQAEAEALVRLLEDFPRTLAWLSFSCWDERRVSHGKTLASATGVILRVRGSKVKIQRLVSPQRVPSGRSSSVRTMGLLAAGPGVAWSPGTRPSPSILPVRQSSRNRPTPLAP
jgi:homocysteine S-methyltransferase